MEPLNIPSSPNHTLHNWGMFTAEKWKPGRDNINWFLSLSYFQPYNPTAILLPFHDNVPKQTPCAGHQCKDSGFQETEQVQEEIVQGDFRTTLACGFCHGWCSSDNKSKHPIGSHSLGNWKVSEKKLLSHGNSWFYNFMVYCNILILSRGTIFLEDEILNNNIGLRVQS